jgi:hypothetical protein
MAKYIPTQSERLEAVWHVVYEYANLVSSGDLLRVQHGFPINTYIQDAFLLNCRKVADFFVQERHKDDVIAEDFTNGKVDYALPSWNAWCAAMDKQLAHLTYTRVNGAIGWDGSANWPLLSEFQNAWRQFLAALISPYDEKFREQLRRRQGDAEYKRLDLGL